MFRVRGFRFCAEVLLPIKAESRFLGSTTVLSLKNRRLIGGLGKINPL